STQVSYHRLRRLYDLYLTNYHRALGPEIFDSPEKIVAENDVTMMARIMADAKRPDTEAGKWASRIVERRHHRLVYETSDHADAQQLRRSKHLKQALEKQYDREFVMDTVTKRIHDLEVPGDPDPGVQLQVVGPSGQRRLVTEESRVLASIPRKFQV